MTDTDRQPLSAAEIRVLGALIEKERTTPNHYPLTLNALVAACNQKSNRDPVLALDEGDVLAAIEGLRAAGLAVKTMPQGSRTEKFRHFADTVWDLGAEELAVLTELMLRGPQTVGELKTRADRLAPIGGLAIAQQALDALAARTPSMVVRLARRPGQKEARWAQLLCGDVDEAALSGAADDTTDPAGPVGPVGAAAAPVAADNALCAEVAALRAELDELKAQFAAFREQFD